MIEFKEDTKKYFHKTRFPPIFYKGIKLLIMELCLWTICLFLENVGKLLDEVTAYNGPEMLIFGCFASIIIPLFYFSKGISGKYRLDTISIQNDVIIIPCKNKKKIRAVGILQITNLPKNIVVREERIRKKKIEKLMNSSNFQYLHYHLTLLAKVLPQLSYEMRVFENDIRLRLFLTQMTKDRDRATEILRNEMNFTLSVFQNSFPGIKIEILQGTMLESAWRDIFGKWGKYKYEIKQDLITIDRINDNSFMAILQLMKPPNALNITQEAQMDQLIHSVIGSKLDFSYIVAGEPSQICNFSEFAPVPEKSTNPLREGTIQEDLNEIRHSELTGIWNASSYVVTRSNNQANLEIDVTKIRNLFSTIFGTELNKLRGRALKTAFLRIALRCPLEKWFSLTSEQMAILCHLPEHNSPNVFQGENLKFEIPAEETVSKGIQVGRILYDSSTLYPLHLNLEMLRLNIFITGNDGMGKSRLALTMLKNLMETYPEVKWVCFDMKREYSGLQQFMPCEIIDFTSAPEVIRFGLNIFDPCGSNAEEHARKLLGIFKDLLPQLFNLQQMEEICGDTLKSIVKTANKRNLKGFITELHNITYENKLDRNLVRLIDDLIRFCENLRGSILDSDKTNIDFNNLYEKKTIIDLFPFLEKGKGTVAQIALNLLLKYLIDSAVHHEPTNSLKYILIIEDAHLICPSIFREVPETAIEDIPLLLRRSGISMVLISSYPEIGFRLMENSKTKFIFKSQHFQSITNHFYFTKEYEDYLRNLAQREALVILPNFNSPFKVFTDYIDLSPKEGELFPKTNSEKKGNLSENKNIFTLTQDDNFSVKEDTCRTGIIQSKLVRIHLTKVQEILQGGPLNSKVLAEKLSVPEDNLDELLEKYINQNQILSIERKLFNPQRIEKLFFRSIDLTWIEMEIREKIETDLRKSGLVNKLPEGHFFDYLSYKGDVIIKIISPLKNLQSKDFPTVLQEYFEKALEYEVFNLILIIPFKNWAANFEFWLKKTELKQIIIWSYMEDNWNDLIDFFQKTISREDI